MAAKRGLVAVGMLVVFAFAPPAHAARKFFFGSNVGPIPDGPAGCADYGAPRDVTFAVTGMTGRLGSVQMLFDMNPVHTWVGDLEVTLIAPNGDTQVLFDRTGATTPTAFGDSSDVDGLYTFVDHYDAGPGNWWTAATAAGGAVAIPAGRYRTSTSGGGAFSGGETLMNPAFSDLTTAQINGTWTLRFRDHCNGDTGTVGGALLLLFNPAVLDFDGDGKTDYAVVRNTGGGPSGIITWYASVPPSPLLFRDGVETGNTTKWSLSVP